MEAKWGEQYPIVIKSWRDKWDNLSRYFQYTEPIRRIIYTTNIVEGYHRQVRKITKTKGVFPNDALYKLVYLAYRNIRKKWTQPQQNWGMTAQQLASNLEIDSVLFEIDMRISSQSLVQSSFMSYHCGAKKGRDGLCHQRTENSD